MSNEVLVARPKSYWVIAVLALAWNAIGVAMWWMQTHMPPQVLAGMTEAERSVYAATPGWVNWAFAVAVFAGVFGALGLLVKKRWAVPMFALSLVAVLVQIAGAFATTPAWAVYGLGGLAMPAILVAIGLFLLGYARKAAARGWIG